MASTYIRRWGLLSRGLFACRIDPTGASPKQTWVLDLMQFAEAEQWSQGAGVSLPDAAGEIFYRTLPEVKTKLAQKNLGLDYRTLDRAVAKGDIRVHRFPEDWVADFNGCTSCPTERLVEDSADWRSSRSYIRLRCRRRKSSSKKGIYDGCGRR